MEQSPIRQKLYTIALFLAAAIALNSFIAAFFVQQPLWYILIGIAALILVYCIDFARISFLNTSLTWRILKRQELFAEKFSQANPEQEKQEALKSLLNKLKNRGSDSDVRAATVSIDKDGIEISGDDMPENIMEFFEQLGASIKKSLESELGKNIDDMSVEELKEQKAKAIEKEDYEKARFFQQKIAEREK
jgi:hypothetical protein